jgi:hypothetical protein
MNFLQPLIELRHSLPDQSTLDDLIIANVKRGVDEVCQTEVSRLRARFDFESDLESDLKGDYFSCFGSLRAGYQEELERRWRV